MNVAKPATDPKPGKGYKITGFKFYHATSDEPKRVLIHFEKTGAQGDGNAVIKAYTEALDKEGYDVRYSCNPGDSREFDLPVRLPDFPGGVPHTAAMNIMIDALKTDLPAFDLGATMALPRVQQK